MECNYCGKEGDKLMRVGPDLRYCDRECYLKKCIEKFPGTSLTEMATRIMLELKEGLDGGVGKVRD